MDFDVTRTLISKPLCSRRTHWVFKVISSRFSLCCLVVYISLKMFCSCSIRAAMSYSPLSASHVSCVTFFNVSCVSMDTFDVAFPLVVVFHCNHLSSHQQATHCFLFSFFSFGFKSLSLLMCKISTTMRASQKGAWLLCTG